MISDSGLFFWATLYNNHRFLQSWMIRISPSKQSTARIPHFTDCGQISTVGVKFWKIGTDWALGHNGGFSSWLSGISFPHYTSRTHNTNILTESANLFLYANFRATLGRVVNTFGAVAFRWLQVTFISTGAPRLRQTDSTIVYHFDGGLCSRTDDSASLHERPRLWRVNCHTSTTRHWMTKVSVKFQIINRRHVVQIDECC